MKTNKRILSGVAGLALVAAFGSSAFGLTITINRFDGYYSGSGGEFNITGSGLNANYNSLALVNGGFETFCLERGQNVSVPMTYNAEISAGAKPGGTGASGGTDLISFGTATLYGQFAAGTLTGYNYTAGATTRGVSAGNLQNAIWFLEQEITLTTTQILANTFLTLLGITSDTDTDIATQRANSGGLSDVMALNFGAAPGFPNQDQLCISRPALSVSDGGTTLLLLGAAMSGVALFRRKLA